MLSVETMNDDRNFYFIMLTRSSTYANKTTVKVPYIRSIAIPLPFIITNHVSYGLVLNGLCCMPHDAYYVVGVESVCIIL